MFFSGGYNNAGALSSVELYFPSNNSIIDGPELPYEVAGATLVQDNGNLVLLGGENPNTLFYDGNRRHHGVCFLTITWGDCF